MVPTGPGLCHSFQESPKRSRRAPLVLNVRNTVTHFLGMSGLQVRSGWGGGVKYMANDDFSEPPRRADSKNLIFIFC